MFSIIIILFLFYFPPARIPPPAPTDPGRLHDEEHHIHIPTPAELIHSEYTPPTYRTAVSVMVANAVWFVAGAIVSIVFLARSTHQARIWAAWLGVLSMVLAAAVYPSTMSYLAYQGTSPVFTFLPKVGVADLV